MLKLLKILFSLIVILIGAAVIAPFLIPLDTYKKEAIARLSDMTGREIRIDGDIRLKLVPNISIALNQVKVGNPQGFKSPYLASIDALDLDVALMPLFDKSVQIQRLTLNKPDIYLETLANGKTNWTIAFKTPSLNSSPTRGEVRRGAGLDEPSKNVPSLTLPLQEGEFTLVGNAYAQAKTAPVEKSFSLSSVNLSGFSVNDGKLHVKNAETKSEQNIEAVNLKADAVSVGKPLAMDGSLKWNGEKFDIAAKAASLQSLLDKKPTQVALKADSTHLKVNYTGSAAPSGIKGKIDIGSPSLRNMMVWLNKPMDYKKTSLLFAANGDIQCSTVTCSLTNAQLAIDALRFTGSVSANFERKVDITGNLKTDMLDVSPYMDAPKTAWNNPFISAAYAAHPRWSTSPIDTSALNAMNADLALEAAKLIAPPWQAANVAGKVTLKGGAANFTLNRASMFDGSLKGSIALTPRDDYLNMSSDFDALGVQIEPFLKTLNNDDRISGTGTFSLTISGRGRTQADLISSLSGKGSVMIRDGAIKGINLAEMARNIQSAFKDIERGTQKTDFAELGGTYTIANGIISNQDLAMKAPFLRMTGTGNINLPAYTISYRLLPELVNTKQGQDGKEKTGIVVPIIVSGPLDNPQFAPDLQGMIQDAINNPEKLKENVKAVKEQIKDKKLELKEFRKDIKEGIKNPEKLLEDPEKLDKLNNLLNQFR